MASISVVIPTYNRQAKTNRAVASILAQGVDCTIIVVDDGSEPAFHLDRSNEVPSVNLIRLTENQGASAARNAGIEACETELIAFLDSDDQMLPDTFQCRIDYAMEHGILSERGNKQIMVCGWREEDADGKNAKVRIPCPTQTPNDLFLGCWFRPGSTAIAATRVFKSDNAKFDLSLKRLEDYDWFIRFALKGGNVQTQQEVMVLAERHQGWSIGEIRSAIDELRDRYGERSNRSWLNGQQTAWLEAYLLYEEAKLYQVEKNWPGVFTALFKSFVKRPRIRLFPGPGWYSK